MVTRLIEDRFRRQFPGAAPPELDEAQNLIGLLGFRNTGFSIAEHALRGIAGQEDQHASRAQAAAGNVVLSSGPAAVLAGTVWKSKSSEVPCGKPTPSICSNQASIRCRLALWPTRELEAARWDRPANRAVAGSKTKVPDVALALGPRAGG